MPLTLGLTGMDPATETALKAAFEQANVALGNRFTLTGEADARYVIVDMDSMYGPMSWLRLHGADKVVVGLTSAPRTQTDFRLARPFNADAVTALLQEIVGKAGVAVAAPSEVAPQPATATPAAEAAISASSAEAVVLPAAAPSGSTPAPAPQDKLPEERIQSVDVESRPPLEAPVLAPVASPPAASIDAVQAPMPEATMPESTMPGLEPDHQPTTTAAAIKPLPPKDRTLADWLVPGVLSGRLHYRHVDCPDLLIDATAREYYGPTILKPLQACFEGAVERDAFAPVDDATWKAGIAKLGAPQPLIRLQWYGGLVTGQSNAPLEFHAGKRYRLGKWPQTEREFPKHFRIASAMMKGPATIAEIAAASSLPATEVAHFVNANLATGYAEFVPEAPPEPDEPPKPTGLMGRLRGR